MDSRKDTKMITVSSISFFVLWGVMFLAGFGIGRFMLVADFERMINSPFIKELKNKKKG